MEEACQSCGCRRAGLNWQRGDLDTKMVERRATKRNKPTGEVQFAGESASGDKTFVILLVGIVALAAAIFGLYYLFGR